MATSNGGFLHGDPPRAPHPQSLLPPWLSKSNSTTNVGPPPSPSVTLSLCPSTVPAPSPAIIHWLQPDRGPDNTTHFASANFGTTTPHCSGENFMISELTERCRELEEGHRAWAAHKKEAAWRLNRLELQLESEKAGRRREKMEETESKVRAIREEGKAGLERIEAEYREQLAGLRRDAESKEQKLAEQWAAKHLRLTKVLEQMGCRPRFSDQANGR